MTRQNLLATVYNMTLNANPLMNWPIAWQIQLCQIVLETSDTDYSQFREVQSLFMEDPEYYGLVYTD